MRSRSTRALAALVATLAVSAAASSVASAHEWQINKKALTGSHEVTVSFSKLKIGDLQRSGGATVLECEGKAKSTLSATKDELNSLEMGSCKFEAGKNGPCEAGKAITFGARGLPWSMELYEEGGKVKDRLKGSGGKEFGYTYECSSAGIQISDTCTTLELSTPLSNVTGGVDAEFGSSKLGCEKGTATSGLLEGVVLYKNPTSPIGLLTVT